MLRLCCELFAGGWPTRAAPRCWPRTSVSCRGLAAPLYPKPSPSPPAGVALAWAVCNRLTHPQTLSFKSCTLNPRPPAGVALAWAVCERLADARCATLLATHFRQLAGLTLLHPCIKIWELQVGEKSVEV